MKCITYSVRAGMSGRMTVDVPIGAIKLRGERRAVLDYAFSKLMGEDMVTGKIDKNSKTRGFLMIEKLSRYSAHRDKVFDLFCSSVRYEPLKNAIR